MFKKHGIFIFFHGFVEGHSAGDIAMVMTVDVIDSIDFETVGHKHSRAGHEAYNSEGESADLKRP